MTLKLYGFSANNCYNKIKWQLLDRKVSLEDDLVWTGHSDAVLVDRSPVGKVTSLDTSGAPILELMAGAEFIEQAHKQCPLLPHDANATAKVGEMIIYMALHAELVARQLRPEAFVGGKVSTLQ